MGDIIDNKRSYKIKKCEDCGGLEFKINYYYTHLHSKKHIRNKNKKEQPNILLIEGNKDNNKHIMENIDNIVEVCNHLKDYINKLI